VTTRFSRLETVIRRAPLGLRFLDLARAAPVADGLLVSARRLGSARPAAYAQRSPLSGVYGFRSLPGLRPYEAGEAPAIDWSGSPPDFGSPPDPGPLSAEDLADPNALRRLLGAGQPPLPANFVVRVEDLFGRFIPEVLTLWLPRTHLIEVPLFSSAARPAPPGLGVVRGDVEHQDRGGPASWAFLTASLDGAVYAAVADGEGRFQLFLPYSGALPPLAGSPPHGSGSIDQLTWPVTIQVFYEPNEQQPVEGLRTEDPPDVRSILGQSLAKVYSTPTTFADSIVRSIRLGAELIVKTETLSQLLVDPA
jgi:hypothetical protein